MLDYGGMVGNEPVQAKLTVGAPNDKYEQEADAMAAQVMSMPDIKPAVQREEMPGEEEELQTKPLSGLIQREAMPEEEEVQMKPLAAGITPLVQREGMPEEEEVQAKSLGNIQREEMPGEEEIQAKSLGSIQREEVPEEEEIQAKSLGNIQREEMSEEEEIQAKPLQRSADGSMQAGGSVESQLSGSKGGGSPLAENVRAFMEPRFGADFSGVRVHTDGNAVAMNKSLGAKAFAHGSDVYYGVGNGPGNDALTAHELTHVVQQTGAKQLQRKAIVRSGANKIQAKSLISNSAPPTLAKTIQRKSAPTSPQSDPAFQAVKQRVHTEATKQKAHPPAKAKATEAQAAAVPPANEKESKAQDRQVQEMNQQQPGKFDSAKFKAALMEKINAATPQNLDQAAKFKDSNKLGAVKGDLSSQVGNEKKQAAGPIEEKTKEPPKTGGIPGKAVTPLLPPPPNSPPADIGAGQAVPKPKDASEVSMQAGSQSLDQQMTDAKVTDEQLAKSNEPEFNAALGTKKEAQTDAAKAPGEYRQQEQATLTQAQAQAQTAAQVPLQGMQGQKSQVLSQVMGQQGTTKGQDEQKRSEIAGRIEGIYNKTKQKVETLLGSLDGEVNQEFDRGATAAKTQFEIYVDQHMKRFKDERYGDGLKGAALWVHDLFKGLPPEANAFYQEGRKQYIASMTATIDRIANTVVTKLNAAKTEISNGKQEIQKYVAGLDPSLRQLGQDAAQTIDSKFDQLEQSVDNKQGELIDSLAQKYNENLQAIDADIEKRKSENQGWVSKAKEAIGGVIQTILELKNMLMGMLAKAAGAVEKIIKDPVGFLGNLVAGIKQGFMGFVGNIGNHLKKGLIGWLTGSLASAGVEMPKSFDLKGIFALVTGILGLTYQGMRDRVANKVGEKKVGALEKGFDMFILWKSEGAAGLWKFVQDKLANLKEMVIGGIQSFVIDTIITAGVTWVLSLLNPASAFVRACKMIIDVIMFFVEKGSQIAELVSAVLDSVGAIADGAIGTAAKLVEGALAKSLPVVIGFLASLIGFGGISGKIRGLIEKARGLIDTAVNWVLSKAIAFTKKLGGKFGFGKKNKVDQNKENKASTEDPNFARVNVPFTMSGESHTLSVTQQGNQTQVIMASSPGPLIDKLGHVKNLVESKKKEYPEETYTHLIKSLDGLIGSVTKISGQLSSTTVTETRKDELIETLKRRTVVNITSFANKWSLKDLIDAPALVGTDPKQDLSPLERKMLSKIKGGSEKLAEIDKETNPRKKISCIEEARVALDALRRGEKVEEVEQLMDREGKKAGKQEKGKIDVITQMEIIEVKGIADTATAPKMPGELKMQIEKYIQKIKKDAKADTSKPPRKLVLHLTQGASQAIYKWITAKKGDSGVDIEVRTGQR
jgi:hypothetical protein